MLKHSNEVRTILALTISMGIALGCSGQPPTCDSNTVGGGSGTDPCASGGASTGGALGTGAAPSTGGAMATGGTLSTGGAVATGGDSSAGGALSTGGIPSTGGAIATGGISSTGGAIATGGDSSTGGALGTGGASSAGGTVATGGISSTGGTLSTGGASSAGGALSTGGISATGGASGNGGGICGNGKVEGTEGCDPAIPNNNLGDGCTPTCMTEPSCPAAGGGCTTTCGDGLVLGSEQCDDGNAANGDGCSSTCQIEAGFTCAQPPLGDTMDVPMVVRDFNAGGDFEKGPGFATNLNYANQGLLQGTLDSRGLKPVLASTKGTYNGTVGQDSGIASAGSFAQWYDDTAAAAGNSYHATVATKLTLYKNSDGSAYVNRFGNNGDGLTSAQYRRMHTSQCGTVNQSNHDANHNVIPCTACYLNSNADQTTPCTENDTTPCQTDPHYTGQCVQNGTAWIGTFLDATFDGNPLWFPADTLTPASPASTAQISGNYDPAWPNDPSAKVRNFSFTTEIRYWFTYDSSKTYKLTFIGDDDVWVFINKKLAVDLGGIHTAMQGDLTFGGAGSTTVTVTPTNISPAPAPITSHPNLDLQNGNIYEIALFQAERQTKASSYQLSLSGFNTARSVCTPN